MRTTIDSYKNRAGRLNLEGINFDDFKDQPLPGQRFASLALHARRGAPHRVLPA